MFATPDPDSSKCGSTKKNVIRNLREKRLEQLREDLKEVDLKLSFSLQQRDKCSNVHNFSKAVEVSRQVDDLRKKKRKYQSKLDLLLGKAAASKRVKKCISKKKKSSTHHTLHQFMKKAVALPPVEVQLSESANHEDDITPHVEVAEDIEVNSPKSDEVPVVLEENSRRADESLPMSCSLPLDQQTCVPEENANF